MNLTLSARAVDDLLCWSNLWSSLWGARSASYDVQLHIRESITPAGIMDSGPAPSGASRIDDGYCRRFSTPSRCFVKPELSKRIKLICAVQLRAQKFLTSLFEQISG
jgi:hypothetical protein